MRRVLAGLILAGLISASPADETTNIDPTWLNQVAAAARQLDYEGVVVYQHDDKMQITRIAHRHDSAGDIARMDTLSGPDRSWLSENGHILCYVPQKHEVSPEHHLRHPFFPGVLPVQTASLTNVYTVQSIGHARIADHEATGVALLPKDAYRYGYLLWADTSSHLLLRLTRLNARQHPEEQFSFTQIHIGSAPSREKLHENFITRHPVAAVRTETPIHSPWLVQNLPAGYQLVSASQMVMPGKQQPVIHLVYSDGLSTASLFVEPVSNPDQPRQNGLFGQNMMNLYTRPLGNYQITALGEVPPATLMMMADSITSTEKK